MLGRVVTTIAFSFPVSDGGPSANRRPPPGTRAAMAAGMALSEGGTGVDAEKSESQDTKI